VIARPPSDEWWRRGLERGREQAGLLKRIHGKTSQLAG
jgi:hypothetical protein